MADSEECQGGPVIETQAEEESQTETERLTAQWSVEDEEEAARERRRRERERQLRSQAEDGLATTGSSSESGMPVQENQCDVKPAGTLELEEDEGFSDWSQKLEQRKQRSAEEAAQDGEQPCHRGWRETQEAAPACQGNRSYEEEDSGLKEAEVKLGQIRFNPNQKFPKFGFREMEVRQDQPEAEADLEEHQRLCEEEHILEEEEHILEEEEQQQDSLQEEEEQEAAANKQEEEDEKARQEVFHLKEKKRRWDEEEEAPAKHQKSPSISSLEGDDQPPLSPTVNIIERTESLNRSIKKSNSVKKSQPPLPVAKIDDKLEQYTHAIESSSKTPKPVRQPSIDLSTTTMAVASTKNLWETGEVAAQSSAKSTPCKDIVAGDIVNKRNLWEHKGGSKMGDSTKTTPSGKKYKFVSIGHGQYKKVLDDATEQ